MTPRLYRRTILALLWALFLALIYARDRKTRDEHDADIERELGELLTKDPVLGRTNVQTAFWLATPEGEQADREARRRIARRYMKDAINRSFSDES